MKISPLRGQKLFVGALLKPIWAGLTRTQFGDPSNQRNDAPGYRRLSESSSGFADADAISYTIPGAAGGLLTTSEDLLRWQRALFGGSVLEATSLALMTAPGRLSDGRTTKFGMPQAWQEGLNADYGFGFFISQSPAGTRIWHSGDIDGFSTSAAHYPDTDLTIVLMQNSESVSPPSDDIEEAVLLHLNGDCA